MVFLLTHGGRALPASRQPTSPASMSPPSEQIEKISKVFRFLRHRSFLRLSSDGRTAASYEEQKIRRENLSGRNYEPADSGIGDFRRAPVRIPRARGTARTFSLACTDWVGSQYYWGVHTCASPKKSQVFFLCLRERWPGCDARLPAGTLASPDVPSIGAGRKNFKVF